MDSIELVGTLLHSIPISRTFKESCQELTYQCQTFSVRTLAWHTVILFQMDVLARLFSWFGFAASVYLFSLLTTGVHKLWAMSNNCLGV